MDFYPMLWNGNFTAASVEAFLKANPNVKVKALSDELLSKTSIAYAVPPREYFFRDWLNAVILNLEENGKLKEILAKWSK